MVRTKRGLGASLVCLGLVLLWSDVGADPTLTTINFEDYNNEEDFPGLYFNRVDRVGSTIYVGTRSSLCNGVRCSATVELGDVFQQLQLEACVDRGGLCTDWSGHSNIRWYHEGASTALPCGTFDYNKDGVIGGPDFGTFVGKFVLGEAGGPEWGAFRFWWGYEECE